ncbi:MAG: histidinol-phosphatase HisJ family protein [Oscillospiraceae bacterium]|nr:histidinol-phosphatase HisJ family protein [Oscillospiraceae bacterium]
MGYKKLLDMHTHTDNSPDGKAAIMHMCECAQSLGLRAIAFTDHCEVDDYAGNKDSAKCVKQAYFEAKKAQNVYRGRLIVSVGVELGQPNFDVQTAQSILTEYDYDIVLASLHNLRDRPDFYFMDYNNESVHDILEEYFKEIIKITKWGNFDSLAHLTYPLRYITGKFKIKVDLNKYTHYTDEILKILAYSGKALELNTSGLRQPISDTMPPKSIIKRFKELGGEFVTIGSDAHEVKDIGSGLDTAMQMLKDNGFNYTTLYQSRVPMPIPIE